MGVYDQALAKALAGEGFGSLEQVFAGEGLEKAQVKAHFRRNAKTGKLEYIQDYDDSRHAHEVHAKFERGDEVEIIEGKNKGRIGRVRSFSEGEHRLSVVFDGKQERSFSPDNVKKRGSLDSGGGPADKTPANAPASPSAASKDSGKGKDAALAKKEPIAKDNMDLAHFDSFERLKKIQERFPGIRMIDAMSLNRDIEEEKTGTKGSTNFHGGQTLSPDQIEQQKKNDRDAKVRNMQRSVKGDAKLAETAEEKTKSAEEKSRAAKEADTYSAHVDAANAHMTASTAHKKAGNDDEVKKHKEKAQFHRDESMKSLYAAAQKRKAEEEKEGEEQQRHQDAEASSRIAETSSKHAETVSADGKVDDATKASRHKDAKEWHEKAKESWGKIDSKESKDRQDYHQKKADEHNAKAEMHRKKDGAMKASPKNEYKATSFKELTPGGPGWKEYWKAHPDEQNAMIAYQKEWREKQMKKSLPQDDELAKALKNTIPLLKSAIAKRKDVDKADRERAEKKYGDHIEYADEKNKKYPINDEEHIRAAWDYINKGEDADKYSPADVAKIKRKIVAAWKKKINKAGPPEADE